MDRSRATSTTSRHESARHNDSEPSPPWEQRHISQVPYITPDSPPLTQAERHALPSFWAARDNSTHERSNSYSHSRPYADHEHSDGPARTPSTAPLNAPPPPMPYESTIVPGPKSAPQLPAFAKGPPSPPDSARLSACSTSKSASPHHSPRLGSGPTITAMPGTMSARERSQSRHRTHKQQDQATKEEENEHVPLGKRMKSAFKDIFKRNPVDETNFERIEDRHWAD